MTRQRIAVVAAVCLAAAVPALAQSSVRHPEEGRPIIRAGVSWRLIEGENLTTVRSLAIDRTGVICAGAVIGFGYLKPDPTGALQYQSLRDKIPEDARQHGDVWRTWATDAGVFFQTEVGIYRWVNDRITVIRPT